MPASQSALSREQLRRGQAGLIRVVLAGTGSNALGQAVGPLFLLSLGATPLHLGLLATLSQFDKLARLLGAGLLGRGFGKVRLMLWGRLAAMPAMVLLVAAAWLGDGHALLLWAALALMGLRGSLQQVGNAAFWPLIQDNTAATGLGQFLTRMRVRQRLLELALPLAVGVWLGSAPAPERFGWVFAAGLLALGLAALALRGVGERPTPTPDAGLGARLWETLSQPAIRRLCAFMVARNFVTNASFPFWVVMLTGQGLSVSRFVWMTSVMAGGQILSLAFWGRLVDRRGHRPVLLPAVGGMALLAGAWPLLPEGGAGVLGWSVALFLLRGVLEAGVQMGQSRAMVDAVPPDLQAEGFAVAIFASALGGGVGGLLGGLLFAAAGTWRAAGLDGPVLYLAAAQLAFLGPMALAHRLPRGGAEAGAGAGNHGAAGAS